MKLSVIIPVYKGEDTIEELYSRIQMALAGKFDYEVIFVNDNALDESWQKIESLQRKHQNTVKAYRLKYNYGQHKAILFGFKVTTGDYIVTIDEDLQHDPSYIPDMLKFLGENNLDVVYGKFGEFRNGEIRNVASKLGRRIALKLVPGLHKDYSPYRIITASFAKKISTDKSIVFIDGLLAAAKANTGIYELKQFDNKRPSSYTFIKLAILAISVILCYSRKAVIAFIIITGFLVLFTSRYIIKSSETGSISFAIYLLSIPLLFIFIIFFNLLNARLKRYVKVFEPVNS